MPKANSIGTLINTLKLFGYWINLELKGSISSGTSNAKVDYKKLGLLSFRLPPQFDSGTHRPLSFLQYAKENDWEIIAITNQADKPITEAGKELLERVPQGTIIKEFDNIIGETSWRCTPKLDGGFANAISLAIRAYDEFKLKRPSVIVASGPPFSFCVAGFLVARALNIPLVLDYRDEWTLCPFEFASNNKLDKWFEKRCVIHAKKVLYTTNSHLLNHKQNFDIPDEKLELVYNGWEDKQFEPAIEKAKSNSSEIIKISFIGRLNEMVSVTPFLSTLKKAIESEDKLNNKIRVEFVGEKSPRLEEELMSFMAQDLNFEIISTPQVSKSNALELMQSSDYLLMLCGKKIAGYIQGKLYDYLSRMVPVIAFGYPGEVPNIVTEFNAGHFIEDNDHLGLANALLSKNVDLRENKKLIDWLSTRTRRYQAKKMYAFLAEVIE